MFLIITLSIPTTKPESRLISNSVACHRLTINKMNFVYLSILDVCFTVYSFPSQFSVIEPAYQAEYLIAPPILISIALGVHVCLSEHSGLPRLNIKRKW